MQFIFFKYFLINYIATGTDFYATIRITEKQNACGIVCVHVN